MVNFRPLLVLCLFCSLQFAGVSQTVEKVKKDSAGHTILPVKDSVLRIDTIVRIDSVYIFDTVRISDQNTTRDSNFFPTSLIIVDSSSNKLPSLDDMVNSINFVKQLGIFKLVLILFIIAIASGLTFALRILSKYLSFKGEKFGRVLKGISVARTFVWLVTFYSILKLVFVQTQFLLLLFILISLVLLGIAALPLLGNLLGRIFILSGNMFNHNDYIKAGIHRGFVQEIGLKHVTILSDEGSAIFIPNSYFINNPFENVSRGKKEEQISLDFDFPSKYDPERVLGILKEAAISNPYLYINKEPEVFIKQVDFINDRYTIKVNLYLYDSNYIDELYDSINKSVLAKLTTDQSENK
ncbi:MAG: mechanosensitive ion channel family protein [Bacteroidetes bacterium]|nr:mechanosensitive ion channel family protein [Bacteroidota bacterium]